MYFPPEDELSCYKPFCNKNIFFITVMTCSIEHNVSFFATVPLRLLQYKNPFCMGNEKTCSVGLLFAFNTVL